MSDPQVFLVLSSIVLTTLALGYVCLAITTQFRATVRKSAVQEVAVTFKGVHSPDRVVVQQGRLVRFSFTRQEIAVCSERVLFPDFSKDLSLPEYEHTMVKFTPTEPGEYDFHCQMGMPRNVDRKISLKKHVKMKRPRLHLLSYMAALVIGVILFAVLWKWLFGSASSGVVVSGITGVVIAVSILLLWNEFKKQMILTVNR